MITVCPFSPDLLALCPPLSSTLPQPRARVCEPLAAALSSAHERTVSPHSHAPTVSPELRGTRSPTKLSPPSFKASVPAPIACWRAAAATRWAWRRAWRDCTRRVSVDHMGGQGTASVQPNTGLGVVQAEAGIAALHRGPVASACAALRCKACDQALHSCASLVRELGRVRAPYVCSGLPEQSGTGRTEGGWGRAESASNPVESVPPHVCALLSSRTHAHTHTHCCALHTAVNWPGTPAYNRPGRSQGLVACFSDGHKFPTGATPMRTSTHATNHTNVHGCPPHDELATPSPLRTAADP